MIETRCIACGHAFTPAPDAFRRGTWRTCSRCRGDPGEQVSGAIKADSSAVEATLGPPYCQTEPERTPRHDLPDAH